MTLIAFSLLPQGPWMLSKNILERHVFQRCQARRPDRRALIPGTHREERNAAEPAQRRAPLPQRFPVTHSDMFELSPPRRRFWARGGIKRGLVRRCHRPALHTEAREGVAERSLWPPDCVSRYVWGFFL
ncbi:hypothetical protein AAFF_G00146680 [Aldrovandia affinis]|uniref:Uncharacterized protein n=1 Tax=Aldrovandia affinis TaxID=143900 RepID=A0AAD7W970_9TELE|nr:hypothetical protein AAFF_G00146680 [Aldrovandia affinis]